MGAAHRIDEEQARLWNSLAGQAWVEMQALLDQMFKPLEELLVEAFAAGSENQVLDVGCGTGATTLAAARRLGAKGHCVGIDISDPMIAAAKVRAEREGMTVSFIRADAQTHAFTPASFDTIISRLGVMFFDDPIQAFANLRHAARNGAEVRFIAWRSAEENPFMTTAERAAAPLPLNIPARKPNAPGQFAFADECRVRDILEQSGWTGIEIRPIDLACSLPEKELARYLTRLGPVGLALHDADDQTRAKAIETIRPAFDRYVDGADVRFTAACWMARAFKA